MKPLTIALIAGAGLLLLSSRANAATASGGDTGGGLFSGLSGGGGGGSTAAPGPLDALVATVTGLVSGVTSAITGATVKTGTTAAVADTTVYPQQSTLNWSTERIAQAMGEGLAATPGSTLEQVVQKAVSAYGVSPTQAVAAARLVAPAPVLETSHVDAVTTATAAPISNDPAATQAALDQWEAFKASMGLQ